MDFGLAITIAIIVGIITGAFLGAYLVRKQKRMFESILNKSTEHRDRVNK